jgi:hypothetical protein
MTERKKRTAKPKSDQRADAEFLVENASSDAEKRVAVQQLKNVKFRELVTPRVNKVLDSLDKLADAAKPTSYHWTDEEANAIAGAISASVKQVFDKLFNREQAKKAKFSL